MGGSLAGMAPSRYPRRRVVGTFLWAVWWGVVLAAQLPVAAEEPTTAGHLPTWSASGDVQPSPAGQPSFWVASPGWPAEPDFPPSAPACCAPNGESMSLGGVIRESIFGPASEENWSPLSLRGFFTEGWDQPFVNAPAGSNEAPRQPWLGAGSGLLARAMGVQFYYTHNLSKNGGLFLDAENWSPAKPNTTGSEYNAAYQILIPLNRRVEVIVTAPFIGANGVPDESWSNNFGDLMVDVFFQMIDSGNFCASSYFSTRTPTGHTVNGNGLSYLTPGLEFWWNFAPKWVMRGETGINIQTNRPATNVYFDKLAIGRYLTGKDAPVFKTLALYMSVSQLTDVQGKAGHITDLYLLPGFSFGLGKDLKWLVQAAPQVPVSGPRPYDYQMVFSLIRIY